MTDVVTDSFENRRRSARPEPEPIGLDSLVTTRPFPTEVCPAPLRDMVHAVASNVQVPEELPALLGLAALGILAGPRIAVSRGHGWSEPLTLYAVVAMESGSGKSPAEKDVVRPLREIQKRLRANHLDGQELRKKPILSELGNQQNAKEAKGATPETRRACDEKIKELKEQLDDIDNEELPRVLLGSDTTPEALAAQMAANGDHAGIMDAEGGFFAMLSGRYTKGIANLEVTLKGYDGDHYEVGRIGRSQRDIDRAVLGLGLAVQPVVLQDAAKDKAMRERGFLGRCLFAVPESLLGTRKPEGAPYDGHALLAWSEALDRISYLPITPANTWPFPALQLSPRARALHVEFKAWLEPRLHPADGDLSDLPGWAGKHPGRALRIAGLLHLLETEANVDLPIGGDTMTAAIAIAKWAIPHAVTVFGWDRPAELEEDQNCLALLGWLRRVNSPEYLAAAADRKPVTEITTRDVQRSSIKKQKWIKDGGAEAVNKVIDRLTELGWLTREMRLNKAGNEYTVHCPHPEILQQVNAA